MPIRRRTTAGLSLGFVLMMIAMLLLVVMTMAAVATTTLNLSRNAARSLEAGYLAESAALQALSRIHGAPTFGGANEQVFVQPDRNDPTRWGLVTFNPASKYPYSTNNLEGARSTGHGGAPVPSGSVRLVATGEAAGMRKTVEMYARVPRFPYVLAVGEALSSADGLEVRAASSMADFVAQEGGAGTAGLPASVAAAGSIRLAGVSVVTGDVVCPGQVTLAPGTTVGGVVRDGVLDLPNMDPGQWEPVGDEVESLEPVYNAPTVTLDEKRYLSEGSVRFDGDLVLKGSLLYVKGNLAVAGSVSGYGALLVEGDTTISAGSTLSAGNTVALICAGNVKLQGTSGSRTYFQGLVYARGDFVASDLSIAGTFISGGGLGIGGRPGSGTSTSTGDMTLSNVKATYVPEVTELSLNYSSSPPDTMMTPVTNYRPKINNKGAPLFTVPLVGDFAGAVTDGGFTLDGQGDYYVPKLPVNGVLSTPGTGMDVDLPDFGPRVVDAVLKDLETEADDSLSGGYGRAYPDGAPYFLRTADVDGGGDARFVDVMRVFLRPHPDHATMDGASLAVQIPALALDSGSGRYTLKDDPNITYYAQTGKFGDSIGRSKAEEIAEDSGTTVDAMISFGLERQEQAKETANQVLDGTVPMGGKGTVVDLGLNQFLGDSSPLRVTSWRDS